MITCSHLFIERTCSNIEGFPSSLLVEGGPLCAMSALMKSALAYKEVSELSDDGSHHSSPAKPALATKDTTPKQPKQKQNEKPETKSTDSKPLPTKPKGKTKAKSAPMKKPSARDEGDSVNVEVSMKRPAAALNLGREPRIVKAQKCFYRRDGTHGIKVGGRQVLLVPWMHCICPSMSFHLSSPIFIFLVACSMSISCTCLLKVKPRENVSAAKIAEIAVAC